MQDMSMQVLVGGKVLVEQNGIVKVPWNSEYVVRIKNRHRLPAAVALFVDNQAVKDDGGMLALFGNSTIDIPGFLGPDGRNKAFTFVPSGDSRIAQPGEKENGIIMARVYLQDVKSKDTIIIDHAYPWPVYYPAPIWIWYPTQTWQPYLPNPVWCSSNSNSHSNSAQFTSCAGSVHAAVNVGATVPGSDVYQKLNHDVKFDLQVAPIELTLKLQGCAKLSTRKVKRAKPSPRSAKKR